MAVGLLIYAAWRLVTVLLPADNDLKGWLTRAGYLVSAVVYVALAWTAASFARNPGKPADGEDSKVESFSSDLMSHSGGRTAVFLIGVVLLVIAAAFLWKALSASFTSQLMPGDVGPISHRVLVILGRVGWGRTVGDDDRDRVLPRQSRRAVQSRRSPGSRRFAAQGGNLGLGHGAGCRGGWRPGRVWSVLRVERSTAPVGGGGLVSVRSEIDADDDRANDDPTHLHPNHLQWLRTNWPIDRHQWVLLGVALVGTVGVFVVVGLLMTDVAAPNFITRFDQDLAERLASNRTSFQDELAHWGSFIASTPMKIGITALVAVVALVVWRRWHETVFVALTLIFEASAFIVVTYIVSRSARTYPAWRTRRSTPATRPATSPRRRCTERSW